MVQNFYLAFTRFCCCCSCYLVQGDAYHRSTRESQNLPRFPLANREWPRLVVSDLTPFIASHVTLDTSRASSLAQSRPRCARSKYRQS